MQHEAEQTENVVSVLIDHAILEADVMVILYSTFEFGSRLVGTSAQQLTNLQGP